MFDQLQQMLRERLGMGGAAKNVAGYAASAAQRDFPGQTNYRVPEDNMMNTPYLSLLLGRDKKQQQPFLG